MGRPVAGLWASEGPIYQRFGYGMATVAAGIEIERQQASYYRPLEPRGRVTLIDKPQALEAFPAIYDRVLARQPGMLSRSRTRWEVVHADLEHWRNGFGALFFALHQDQAGRPDGYITYRVKTSWDDSANIFRVRELMAETFDAYAELWRFGLDHDLMTKIEAWPRPPDEPLLHMLAHPRALSLKFGDGLWLRLIDVAASLAGRRYSADDTIVFEVRDSFCPWNEGRYELSGGPDGAQCSTTRREPDLLVDIRDLGAAFLGGTRFSALARAGRVREEAPSSLARADAMFGWDRAPWCPEVF
jgi:predicted acetyltransferase